MNTTPAQRAALETMSTGKGYLYVSNRTNLKWGTVMAVVADALAARGLVVVKTNPDGGRMVTITDAGRAALEGKPA